MATDPLVELAELKTWLQEDFDGVEEWAEQMAAALRHDMKLHALTEGFGRV